MSVANVTERFPIPLKWPRLELLPSMVTAIAIHHTAVEPYAAVDEAPIGLLFPAAQMTVEDELNHIAVIHLYHQSKGFGGFGYHFIVFPSGRAYLVTPLDQWGAGVGGENDHLWHIVFAGDFRDRLPGAPQIAGARECVRRCNQVKKVAIYPHKAWGGTTCPCRVTEILNELIIEEDEMTEEEMRALLEEQLQPIRNQLSILTEKVNKTYNQVNVKAGAVVKNIITALNRLKITVGN